MKMHHLNQFGEKKYQIVLRNNPMNMNSRRGMSISVANLKTLGFFLAILCYVTAMYDEIVLFRDPKVN